MENEINAVALNWSFTVPHLGYITACDQSMVESGMTEGGKNTASFHLREWTQQHKYETSS